MLFSTFKALGRAGVDGVNRGDAEHGGAGAAAPPAPRDRVPGDPLMPRTGAAGMQRVPGIFQKLSPSFLPSGRCLLAARDSFPSLPHLGRLAASCLPLSAKPSVTDRAPVPCPLAMSRAVQAGGRAPAARQGGSSQCQACVFVV